jgi:periplasmic protein TonB
VTERVAPWTAPFDRGRPLLSYGASLALHAAFVAAILLARPAEQRAAPVTVEIVETRPAAPTPEPPTEPPRPPPRPVRRTAKAPELPLPEDAPPPPAEQAPPPPNAPPSRPGPVRIGVSMSSTSAAGGYAAPSGNTLYGRPPARAQGSGEGAPPAAERYAPPSQVTSLPEPLGCDIPKSEYPEEARRLGIEGEVKLRLVIDDAGKVADVKVLRDPGHGFGTVAERSARTYCRFRPARKNGQAVATEIPYTIRFEL